MPAAKPCGISAAIAAGVEASFSMLGANALTVCLLR
jgi:hypothetical protein